MSMSKIFLSQVRYILIQKSELCHCSVILVENEVGGVTIFGVSAHAWRSAVFFKTRNKIFHI